MEDTAGYDIKLKELQVYLPFLESMRAKIHANSHDRLDEKARAEYLAKIHTLKSFLTDKGRRMKMDNLKKCETVLIKLSQKFEKTPGADSPMTADLQTTDSFDPLINAKQKKMSSESNITIPAVSMNFYKELTENTETKEILNEINSLPITDTSDESANVASSELEMCRVKLKSVFKMGDQKTNIEESLFTRRLVNPSSQQQPSPKVNEIKSNLNSDSNLIPEKKLASERRPNYTRVLRSPNKNSPHSDRRSGSGSFSPVRRKSRDRYERHKRRSPEQKRSSYKPNRSPSSSKSRNYFVRQNDSRDSKRDKYYRESDSHKSRPRRRSSLSPRNKNDKINSKILEKKHDKTIRDKRENQRSVSKSDAIETYEIQKLNKLKSQLERELQENSNYDDLTDSSTPSPNSEPSDNADAKILIEKEDGEIGETDEEEDKNIDLLYGNLLDGIREDTIKDSKSDGKKTLYKKPDNTQQLKTSDNNVGTKNISDFILKSLTNYNQSKSNACNNKVLTLKKSIDSDNIEDSNKKAKSPQKKKIVNPLDKPCAKKPTEEPKKIEVSSGSVPKVSPPKKKVSSSLKAINASTTFEQDILQALSKEIKETTPSVISFSKCTEIKPSIKRTEPLESAQQKSRRISLEKYKEKNSSSSFEISKSHGKSVQSTDLSKKYEVYKKYVSSVLTPKERERFTSILDNTVEETIGDFDSIPKPRVNNLVPTFQSPVVNCDIINYVAPESPDSNSSFVYDMPSSPIEKPSIDEPPLTTNNQISTTKVDGKQCVQVMRTMGNNLPSWVAPNHKNYDGTHTISNTYSSMTSPNNTATTGFSNASGNKPGMVPSPSALTNPSSTILPSSLDVVGKVIESFTVPDVRQGNQIPQCSPRPSHFPNENINVRGDNTNFRFSSPTQFYQHRNQPDQSKSDSFPSAQMRPQNVPPLMSYPFHEDVDVNYASVKYGSEKPFPMLMNQMNQMNQMNPIYQHNSPTNAMNTHFNVGHIKPSMSNIPVMINSNFPNRKMPTENTHVHSRDPRERNYGGNFHQESNLTRCSMDNRRQTLGNPELLMDMQFVQKCNKMPPERSFFQECSLNQISSFDELGRQQSQGRQLIPNMDSNSINRQITGQQIPPNAVYNRMDRGQSQGRSYNRELSMGRTVISNLGDQNHGRSYNREPSMGRVSILDAGFDRMSRGRSQGRPCNRESSVGRTDISDFSSDRMNRGRSQGRSYNREPSLGRMSISNVTSDRTSRGKSQGRSFNREPSMGRLDMNIIQSDRRNRDRSVGRSLNRDRETISDIRSRRQSQGRSPNRDSSSKRSFTSDSTPSNREPSVGRFHSSSTDKNIGDNISYSSKRNSSSSRSNQDKDKRSETPRRQTESQGSSKTNPKDPRNRRDDSQRNSTEKNIKKAFDSKNPSKKTADKQRDFSSKLEQQNKRAENVKSKNECNDRLKYGPLHNAKPTDKNTLTTRSFSSSRSSADSQGIKFKIPKIKKVPAEVIKTINEPVAIPDQVLGFSKLCSEEPQASANDANRVEEMNLTETKICITESLISNVVDENCATIDRKSAPEIEDPVPKRCCKDESKTNSNEPNKEKAIENSTQLVTDADEVNCIDSTAPNIGMKTDTISEIRSEHIEVESSNNLVSSTKSSEIIHDNVELNEAPTSSDTKVDDMKSLNDEVVSSIANILKDRSTMLEMLAFLKSKSGNETEKIEKIFERITELNKDELNPVIDNEQETDKSPDIDKNSSVDKTGNNSTDTDIEGTVSVKESSSQDDEKEDSEHVVSSSSQKTAKTSKKYSKGNRELMMLQEDLREMFISQGVMDAENLGFRMCRLTSETKPQPEVVRRRKRSLILEKTESLKPSKPIAKRKKPSPKKSTKQSKVISNINDKKFPQVYIEELNSADKALSISNVDDKTSNVTIYDYDESNEDVELFAKSNSTKISNHNNPSITPIKSKVNPIKSLKRVKLGVKVVKKSGRKRPRKIFTMNKKRKTKKFLRQPLIDQKSNKSIDVKGSGDNQSTTNQPSIIDNELDTVPNDELDIVVADEQDNVFDNDQDTVIIATNVRKAAAKKISTPISKKKKRGNWSMKVIKRKKRVKDNKKLPISSIETDKPENDFVETFDETTYHFLSGSLKYSCTLCKTFHGADIVGHFKNFHPHSEVLISRLHPGFARLAIHESHHKQPTDTEAKNDYDYKFQCRFCERLFVNVTPKTFFSHVVRSHTGEYRAKCNLCSKNGSMKMIHACNKFSDLPPALTTTEVFGYICGLCYYTQVSEENLKQHISFRHTNTECEIIKINLSNNIFDSSDTLKNPEPIPNKMLTRSKILKPESPLNDTATTPEKRKKISTPTEIPNKKPASDIVVSIQPQPVVVLEKSCPSENMLKTSFGDLSESAPLSLDESEVNVKLIQTLEIKQEVIDSTNQKTIQETNVAKKNLVMKEEPPSQTNVIVDSHIQTNGKAVDMGVLQITQYKNGSATYDCRIRACAFHTNFFLIFVRHVKSFHSHDEWDGFCKVCSFQTIKEQYSSYVDALDHLMAHINVDASDNVMATVKSEVVPTVAVPAVAVPTLDVPTVAVVDVTPVQPKIQVRPLSDLMAKKPNILSDTMEQLDTPKDFAVSELCIESVVSLCPKNNIERCQDDKTSKLLRSKCTPNIMKKSGTVVISNQTMGQPVRLKPDALMPSSNENLDTATGNSQSSEEDFEKNELFKCGAIDCVYSTNDPKTFIDHIENHFDISPNFECKCIDCSFTSSTGFDLVLHIERAHNNQPTATKSPTFNINPSGDNAPSENSTASQVLVDLQEADKGNIDGILPKNSVFSRYSCTAAADTGGKCGATFLTPQLFLEHIKKDHRVRRIKCHECDSRALIFWTLIYHLRLCHSYCLYACVYCGANFDIEISAQRHLICEHADKRQLVYMRHVDVATEPLKKATEQIILLDIDPKSIARSIAVKKLSEGRSAPIMAAVLNSIPAQTRRIPKLFPIVKRNSTDTAQSRDASPVALSKAPLSPAVHEQSIGPVIEKSASLESKNIDKLHAIQKSVKSNKESIAVPPVKDDNNSLVINLDSDEDDNIPLALTQIKIASKKNVSKEAQKNADASKAGDASLKSTDDKESPVECIELLSDDESTPNENSIQTSSPVNKTNESTPQRKKSITEDTISLNSGLIGRDLYRCGNNQCSFSSITSSEFKDHLTICDFAKEHSKLPCYHCKRKFKSNMSLLDHIHNHGLLRYKCSVCNVVMRSALALNSHMNRQHKVSATTVVPCDPFKTNVDTDEFIVKPVTTEKNTRSKKGKVQPKPPQPAALSSSLTSKKLTFDPDDINDLPLTPVFSDEVHCKKCTYATKVRSNMIRHLFLHSNEISVPSAAPVNPVPSSGPKHFDTMSNLALSSNLDRAPAVRISTERQERIKSGTNVKKLENIPAYIPKKERFVCGAKSCSYISVDEMMLRCHWEALHHEETVFKCAHCAQQIWAEAGRRLTTGDIGDHLMLHKATLYQCNSCNFLHPQVKGIERHTIENACNGGVPKLLRERRAWQCEICSTRTVLKSEIVQHCKQAHNALNQFKCSLCLHYNSSKDCFFDHFKKNHSGRTVDVVSMYSKGEDPFDVSPLWWKQRKRGSGFVEEVQDMPAPKKIKIDPPPACEKTAEEVETAPESIHYIINNLHEMDTDLDIKPDLQILSTTPIPPQTSATDHNNDDTQLLELMPQTRLLIELPNKLFQCAMCSEYTSKFQSDMKIHLYEELNYRKWSCEVCNYRSFDEASIINHCMQAHRIKKIKELSPHKKIEDWVEKNLAVMNNALDTPQETVQDGADSDAGKSISSKTTSETITTLHEKLYAMNNASVVAAPSSSGVDQLNDLHDNLFMVLYDSEKVEFPAAEVSDPHLETGNKAVHTPVKRGQKQKLFSCGHCNFATSAKTYVRRHHRNKHSSLEYKLITLGEADSAVSAPPAVPSPAVVSRQEKNFMCLVCEMSVANLDIVQHHQSCHPNETNQVLEKKIVVYKCQLCMQLTACLPTMMEHFEKLHPDVEKNYVMHKLGSPKFKKIIAPKGNRGAESNSKYYCRYCPRVLSDFPSLLEHHQLCHSDDLIGIMPGNNSPIDLTGEINTCESILSDLYDCKISGCDYTSESTQDYLFHTRSHYVSYKCDICSVYFIKYSGYVKHKSEHANAQVKPKFAFINNFVVRQRLRQIIDMLGKTFPSIGNIQLDHFLQTDIDDADASQNQIYSIPTTATRLHQVARKSTTQIDVNPFPRLVIAEEEERDSQPILGYSNYGKKPDTDFKGITAKIPIMGRSMPFTIDKLSELFQLFPNVLVEDCRRGET